MTDLKSLVLYRKAPVECNSQNYYNIKMITNDFQKLLINCSNLNFNVKLFKLRCEAH